MNNNIWICPNCGHVVTSGNICDKCATSQATSSTESTTQRFIFNKGNNPIIDIDNNYNIYYTEEDGYIAYNDSGREVYHIYPDGTTCIKKNDGSNIISHDSMKIEDFTPNMTFNDKNGHTYTISSNGRASEVDYTDKNRFLIENQNPIDGSTKIIDRFNDYTINYTENDGYKAYNKDGKIVYHIDSDGQVKVYDDAGKEHSINASLDIADMKSDMTIEGEYGDTWSIVNGKLKESVHEGESVSEHYYYNDDGSYYVKSSDGYTDYIDNNGSLKTIYDDGVVEIYPTGYTFSMNPDGTYNAIVPINNDEVVEEKGTYQIDSEGNYIFNNDEGTFKKFDKSYQLVDFSGDVYYINEDYSKDMRIVSNNGKVNYSMINHIEYDEEAYTAILNGLNSVDGSSITSACSNIESAVNSFPDSYSCNIGEVGSGIAENISLISSLSEMVNYSLLAYQTCDEKLRDALYSLVDSLFGDSDSKLGDSFKSIISGNIENKDGIIGYNKDTNFKRNSSMVALLVDDPNIEFLSGIELTDFIHKYNLKESDSLLIAKDKDTINDVSFDVYKVIDIDNVDVKEFSTFISDSEKAISNVNSDVLKYISNSGGHLVYFSNYTVDNNLYDEDGQFNPLKIYYAGLAKPTTKGAISVCGSDPEALLHELGHTFDHCIYTNQTGEIGSTTNVNYNYNQLPDQTNTRELAHNEYSAYNPNYVYVEDYSNSDKYKPKEFFAESFRNYYTTDEEKRAKFADLIPETFSFFDKMEEWVGEQNANK